MSDWTLSSGRWAAGVVGADSVLVAGYSGL